MTLGASVAPGLNPVVVAKKQFPMLPWFPANFHFSTLGWSVTARGIYRELLDYQWEMGGLPNDPEELRNLIRATKAEWKEWPRVACKFPVGEGGLRRNPRLEAHRHNSMQKSQRAAASAQKRWDPPPESPPETVGSHAHS